LKRTIEIPLKHILDVSTEKVSWDFSKQVKVAGAHIPYLIKEGLFLSDEGLIFFDMHNTEKCITIVLDNEKYKKIVFEVDDKENRNSISFHFLRLPTLFQHSPKTYIFQILTF